MPEAFEDVAAAWNYFNLMVRQTTHYGCAFSAMHARPKAVPGKPSLSFWDAETLCTDTEFLTQGKGELEQAERWMVAFRSLFDMKRRKKGSKECLAVSAL